MQFIWIQLYSWVEKVYTVVVDGVTVMVMIAVFAMVE